MSKKKRKRLEFYQRWLVACMALTLTACFLSYILAFLGLDPVAELSIALVDKLMTIDIVSMLGYAGQNSVRAWAADKYGRSPDLDDDVAG